MAYVIKELEEGSTEGVVLRGAVRELWGYKGPEAMVSGPAETGKTMGSLIRAHALCLKYPGCQGAFIRQTYQSMPSSVLLSYEKKVLGDLYKTYVKPYGGEKPEWYDYPNGSRIWVGGLDNPDKVLSSERDWVYINQAEEIAKTSWEYIITRTTGRSGNMPWAQVWGDCNPGPPSHWIINRPSLKIFFSKHEDNPTLFNDFGVILPQGIRSLEGLDLLTGVTKERMRYGRWAGAEGTVYDEFDPQIHIVKDFSQIPHCQWRIEVVDFGYTNPFSWQNIWIDDDGRGYVVQEIYRTERIVEEHCEVIKKVTSGKLNGRIQPKLLYTICDHDAEDRATYEKHMKRRTKGADKLKIRDGIDDVKARLKLAGDGKPRWYYYDKALVEKPDQRLLEKGRPTCAKEEVNVYVWPEEKGSDEVKDVPVKQFDHAMDGWRYVVRHLDRKRSKGRTPTSMTIGSS